jgi:CheY-like chemotaxis protein
MRLLTTAAYICVTLALALGLGLVSFWDVPFVFKLILFSFFSLSLFLSVLVFRMSKIINYKNLRIQAQERNGRHLFKPVHEFWLGQMAFIRKQLNGIIGVQDLYSVPSEKNSKDYMDIVSYCSERIRVRIDKLQVLFEISQPQFAFDVETLSMSKVLSDSIQKMSESHPQHNLKLTIKNKLDSKQLVYGNENLLGHFTTSILDHFISAGLKNHMEITLDTPTENKSRVRLHFSTIEKLNADELIKFEFLKKNVYSIKKQWPSTDKELNLYLLQYLTHCLDSQLISVANTMHEICFSFELPMPTTIIAAPKTLSQLYKTNGGETPRVLIVEDDITCEFMLKHFLYKLGAHETSLDFASNGSVALQKCTRTRYDLIFMDLDIPLINGSDATYLIRKNTMNSQALIIATSSMSKESDRQKFYDLGGNDFIEKPLKFQTLCRTLINHGLKESFPCMPDASDLITNETSTKNAQTISMSGQYLINFSSLYTDLNEDMKLCLEVLSLASNSLSDLLVQIEHNMMKNRWTQLHSPIHRLKGELLSIKCQQGAMLAAQLEENLTKNNIENSKLLLQQLLTMCGALFREMDHIQDQSQNLIKAS